jgi:hypothetical protein
MLEVKVVITGLLEVAAVVLEMVLKVLHILVELVEVEQDFLIPVL